MGDKLSVRSFNSQAKQCIKAALGAIPLTVETLCWLRQQTSESAGDYSPMSNQVAAAWRDEAMKNMRHQCDLPSRRILVFTMGQWAMPHDVALAVVLAGLGYKVDLAILPYAHVHLVESAFDMRRRRYHLLSALREMDPLVKTHDLSMIEPSNKVSLSHGLLKSLQEISYRDTQWIRRRENVRVGTHEQDSELFQLRLRRNTDCASALWDFLRQNPYNVIFTHNGKILEFGVVFATAQHLGLSVVTQEFGEQRERCWVAHESPALEFEKISDLWREHGQKRLLPDQWKAVKDWHHARRNAQRWSTFTHVYQRTPSKGVETVKAQLGLTLKKPVVLLCSNVAWDSRALGRQIFTDGMGDWIRRTVRYFARRNDCNLVVRIHPDEARWGTSQPIEQSVKEAVPSLPDHIKLVAPDSDINTYDLIDIAHMGLVYTSTCGLDMVLSGVPVICSGRVHYRGKGFTIDPQNLEDYFEAIDVVFRTAKEQNLTAHQVELAHLYTYLLLFVLPKPFPWVQRSFWEDITSWPISRVLSPEGLEIYGPTLAFIAGLSSR
jgi:Capsule polysaccharide biosynthesis protein